MPTLLAILAVAMVVCSAGKFGFRASSRQCPTAPVQIVAIMKQAPDGSMVRELRAPRPGEKDYVVCHCQERRAAATVGWYVPTFMPALVIDPPKLDCPVVASAWVRPPARAIMTDPPVASITHPPSA